MKKFKEVIRVGQIELHFLLDGQDTNNEMVMFECVIPAGAKVPVPHYHEKVDEAIYGLEGVTTTTINGVKTDVHPGETIFVPRGAVHYHENLYTETARALSILTPASIGPEYFREMSDLIQTGVAPDPKVAGEIMVRHGLIPAPVHIL
ncbi:MAG: cupin [Chitinophagaceae bacterium]|nr:cupin [Chitinophagaceae bacterium]